MRNSVFVSTGAIRREQLQHNSESEVYLSCLSVLVLQVYDEQTLSNHFDMPYFLSFCLFPQTNG